MGKDGTSEASDGEVYYSLLQSCWRWLRAAAMQETRPCVIDALAWMSVCCRRSTACCRALSVTVNIGKQTAAWYGQPGDGCSLGLAGIAGRQSEGLYTVVRNLSNAPLNTSVLLDQGLLTAPMHV